jgi:hypothetical protein
LLNIPEQLRRERNWTGARAVGMSKLTEERIRCFLSERLTLSIHAAFEAIEREKVNA